MTYIAFPYTNTGQLRSVEDHLDNELKGEELLMETVETAETGMEGEEQDTDKEIKLAKDEDLTSGSLQELAGSTADFLKAEDVGKGKVAAYIVMTIKRVFKKEVIDTFNKENPKGKRTLICFAFEETDKKIYGMTGYSAKMFARHYTDDIAKAIGMQVKLKNVLENFGKERVALRPAPMENEEVEAAINF